MQELAKAQGGALSTVDPFEAFTAQYSTRKTRESYTRSLRQWRAYLERNGLEALNVTQEAVIAYRDELQATRSAATVNAYLTAVRAFYAWLEAQRVYPNIARGVKGLRLNPNSPKDALTVEQAKDVLSKEPETLAELRDFAICNLMMRRGLRTCEVVRADIGDIRQINGEAVLYLQGKGFSDKGEFVILNAACLRPIHAYLEARGESDPKAPLFAGIGNRNHGGRMTTRSVSRIAKGALKDAGIYSATLTAHSYRHTAVTFALLGGASIQETQAMARHASINTTMRYAHNLDRMAGGAEHSIDAFLEPQTCEHMPNTQANTVLPAETYSGEHMPNITGRETEHIMYSVANTVLPAETLKCEHTWKGALCG